MCKTSEHTKTSSKLFKNGNFFLQMFQCVARVRHFWFRNQFGNQNVKIKSVTFLVLKLICHSVIVAFWNNLLWQDDSTHITHNVILGKNLRKWRKWFLWLMMRSSLFLSFVPNPPQSVHHIINNLEQRQKNESSKLFLVRLNRSMFNCSIHENKSKFADLSRCCVEFYMIKIYGAWKHNSTFSSKLAKYLLECKMHHRLN